MTNILSYISSLRKRHFESSKQGETNSRNGDATRTINPKKANPATTYKKVKFHIIYITYYKSFCKQCRKWKASVTGNPVVLVSIAWGFPKRNLTKHLFCLKWLFRLASFHTSNTVIHPITKDWFLPNRTLANCVVLSTYISMRISCTLGMLCIIYNGLDFKSNSYFIILESSGIISLNWLASHLDSSEFTTTGILTKEM